MAPGAEEGYEKGLLMRTGFPFGGDENGLQLGAGGCIFVNAQSAPELFVHFKMVRFMSCEFQLTCKKKKFFSCVAVSWGWFLVGGGS